MGLLLRMGENQLVCLHLHNYSRVTTTTLVTLTRQVPKHLHLFLSTAAADHNTPPQQTVCQ